MPGPKDFLKRELEENNFREKRAAKANLKVFADKKCFNKWAIKRKNLTTSLKYNPKAAEKFVNEEQLRNERVYLRDSKRFFYFLRKKMKLQLVKFNLFIFFICFKKQ